MELEERTKVLHMEHKNHLASLMLNNAKSSLASGVSLSDSLYNKAAKSALSGNNGIHGNDDLGNSSRSQRSNDESKQPEPSAKKMNTGRWSADEHKRFLAGLDQFGYVL